MAALAPPPRLARMQPLPAKGPPGTKGRDRAQTALAFITSDERDVLELCFSAGCPAAEISRKLQIPLGAIKAQLDRGLFGFLHALSLQQPISKGNFRPTFPNQTNPNPHWRKIPGRVLGLPDLSRSGANL